MRLKNFIVAFIVLMTSQVAFPKDLYNCYPYRESTCDFQCVRMDGWSVITRVNNTAQLVQVITMKKNEQLSSYILDKCRVIDDENWECERNDFSLKMKEFWEEKKIAGRYMKQYRYQLYNGLTQKWEESSKQNIMCEK